MFFDHLTQTKRNWNPLNMPEMSENLPKSSVWSKIWTTHQFNQQLGTPLRYQNVMGVFVFNWIKVQEKSIELILVGAFEVRNKTPETESC